MKKLFLSIAAAVAMSIAASAQTDLGAWLNIQATGNFGKAYGFVRGEYRANHNLRNAECYFLATGAGYRVTSWLNSDLSYELWNVSPFGTSGDQMTIHKAVLSLTGTLRSGSLAVSLREKYELSFLPSGKTAHCLRSRMRAQYISDGVMNPYLAAELFAWGSWSRTLFYVGSDIVLSPQHKLDVFYCFHMPNGQKPVNTFGLGYYFSF